MSSETQAPKWFKIVSIFAIVWNLLGIMNYLLQSMMTPEAIANMPENQQALYTNVPAWVTSAFAIAVWFGLIGSIGLFIKKSWCYYALIVSLLGVLIQMYYSFLVVDIIGAIGFTASMLSIMVIPVSIYLVYLSHQGKSEGWIK